MDEALSITGYQGEPVPNKFIRQPKSTSKLAVILPGGGYTAAMPLLFYSGNLCLDRGFDVLTVDYDYRGSGVGINEPPFRLRLLTDVGAALEAGMSAGAYTELVVIGKSLGTMAMAGILSQNPWPIKASIWLTPVLNRPEVVEVMREQGGQAYAAIGDADRYYEAEAVEELRSAGNDFLVIEGAGHGMDIEGDVVGSIEALSQVMASFEAFLDRIIDNTSN